MPNLYQRLAPYIPPPLMRRILTDANCPTGPTAEHFTAAVLFADISGFTPLTEALAQRGAEGPEELTRLLNRYFSRMINLAEAEGGEVVEFGGDSVTVLFIAEKEPLPHAVRRALQAAEAMQAAMDEFAMLETSVGSISLGLKIGIGAGDVLAMQVGGIRERWEYTVAGAPLRQVAEMEARAQPGDVLLSAQAQSLLHPQDLPPHPLPRPDWEGLRSTLLDPASVEEAMRCHVPGAARRWLEQGLHDWLGVLRPMSVLFASLAGLNDEQEDFVLQLHNFLHLVQETLYRYEGTLARLAVDDKGTTIMALLGAPPLAHEDDPTRAVRCAQDLVDLIQERAAEIGLTGLSIGVTTGQVFAGPVGGETRREYTVMGDAVNLAARLMVAAAHLDPAGAAGGHILCDFVTYRQARSQVALEALPAIRVKGKAGLIRVYRPAGTADQRNITAEWGTPKNVLIGRREQVSRITVALDALEAGEGHVIVITGEAGIGKSRLAAELIRLARERGLSGLLGAGQSMEQQTPYRAWRDILSSYFDLEEINDPAERRERVRQLVHELIPDQVPRLPLLNDILNLNYPDSDLTAALDPALRQQSLQILLLRLLRAWAGERPLILILEDAQWLDSLSWDLVTYASRVLAASGAPYLLVLVTRPPGATSLAARGLEDLYDLTGAETISLTTLSPAETVSLAEAQLELPPGGLPDTAASFVQTRAGGNPFFAEQLVLALREQGLLNVETDPERGIKRCRVNRDLRGDIQALPDTIQGLILARIDRLPPERQLTLKVAAVIGRTFAYSPLKYTLNQHTNLVETTIRDILKDLAARNLTALETLEPDLTYVFKHIITQEVAYETLLFAQRRELHRTVAEWYKRDWETRERGDKTSPALPVSLSPYLPLLVHHYHHAEEREEERRYARMAGQQAAARFANTEAVRYFSRALELTPPENARERYELLLGREIVYDRQGNREAQLEDLSTMERLSQALGPAQQAEVALRQARYAESITNYDQAIRTAQEAIHLAVAATAANPSPSDRDTAARIEVAGYLLWGQVLWMQDQFEGSRAHLNQGLKRVQGLLQQRAEQDPIARELYQLEGHIRRNLANGYHLQSRFEESMPYYQEALEIARKTGDRQGEGKALNNLGVLSDYMGNYEQGQAYFEQALEIAQETGDRWSVCSALENLGISYDNRCDYGRAREAYEQVLQIYLEISDRQGLCSTLNNLSVVHLHLGQYDRAQDTFERSREIAVQIGDKAIESIATSGLALVAHYRKDHETALRLGQAALEIAQFLNETGAMAYALTCLGQCLIGGGDLEQAAAQCRRAVELRLEIDQPHLSMEPRAGLARSLYLQGDTAAALAEIEQILDFLEEGTLVGTQEPMLVYWSCYQILQGKGDPRAGEVLASAHSMLQEHAARIPDEESRQSFLENVVANREIIQAWGNRQKGRG